MSSIASAIPELPNNLPLQLTSFVGREHDIAEVRRLLRASRLLTLMGAGGSGKTRLALQVAAALLDEPGEYVDGIYFVPLAAIREPGLVIPAIAQTLNAGELPGQSLEESLKAYLQEKHLLLLLDNFEQVVEASPQVADLLRAAPDLKVMVTSRASLHVSGEQQYPVLPLALPDLKKLPDLETLSGIEAINLFVQRASKVNSHFEFNRDNAQSIAEICHRLDGLPLAIELAAARLNVLTPRGMLEKLGSSLRLLTGGPRDIPARHQTLRAAIEWSYDLLSTGEKELFRRMSVFVGGCTLEALEFVCNTNSDLEIDPLDGIALLVDKSLLRQDVGVEGSKPRYVMLETIKEYAREKLEESGEAEALREAYAGYFLRLAEEADPYLKGKDQHVWLDRLEEEHANINAALRWVDASASADNAGMNGGSTNKTIPEIIEAGLRAGAALMPFWDIRGYYSEGRELLQRFLLAADRLNCSKALRLSALNTLAQMTFVQGDYSATRLVLEHAIELATELEDKQNLAVSFNNLGRMAFNASDYSAARPLYEKSLALRRELGDKTGIAIALNNLGLIAQEQLDYAGARSSYDQSLAIRREIGDKRYIASSLTNLGFLAYVQADYAAARAFNEESVLICQETGDKRLMAFSLTNLGLVSVMQNELDAARSFHEQSLAIRREVGDKIYISYSLFNLGVVTLGQGDYAGARSLYQEGLALSYEVGNE